MNKIELAGKCFFREELRQYIKRIKSCYEVGEELVEKHQKFIKELLMQADPDRIKTWNNPKTKIGVVVSGTSQTGTVYTKFSGQLGEQTMPISINKALDNIFLDPQEQHIKEVKAAARNIISPQIQKYKDKLEDEIQTCALTGEVIDTVVDPFHIDHVTPFWFILQSWMRSKNIKFTDIEVEQGRFKLTEAEEDWSEFHQCHATYQITKPKANLTKGATYVK